MMMRDARDAHSDQRPAVLLAAGGTGGHIFPAEALAEFLIRHGYRILFVTDKRFERYVTGLSHYPESQLLRCTVPSGSLAGHPLRKIKGAFALMRGIWQARRVIRQCQPVAAVGFGGYPSFPAIMAALLCRTPTIIHEQNALLGRTNRLFARYVTVVATSFAESKGWPSSMRGRRDYTGNPVREAICQLRGIGYPPLHDDTLSLLVLGGSQGATVFSDVVPKAIKQLPGEVRQRLSLTQQCREEDLARVQAFYESLQMPVTLAPFFPDVAQYIARAHLVISRAGASSVAELAVAGRPALFVPYPHAMDDHQRFNAEAMVEAGGAWLLSEPDFTPDRLTTLLSDWLKAPAQLSDAASKAHRCGKPDATEALAKLVMQYDQRS